MRRWLFAIMILAIAVVGMGSLLACFVDDSTVESVSHTITAWVD